MHKVKHTVKFCEPIGKTIKAIILYILRTNVYILKRNKNATVLNPLLIPNGQNKDNFFIISCVPAP